MLAMVTTEEYKKLVETETKYNQLFKQLMDDGYDEEMLQTIDEEKFNELFDKLFKDEPTEDVVEEDLEQEIEEVTEEIIDCAKRFKIGDNVYWTPGDSDVVLTITSYDVFDGKKGYKMGGANTAVYWDDELELVNPDENTEEETVTHKFKVGDKVIGNEKANRYGITKEDWIGTVAEVDDNGFEADGFYLDYDCFDLYEESEENND